MSKYNISISLPAYNDIAGITDYFIFELKNRDMGLSIADKIFNAIETLDEMLSRHKCCYKEIRSLPVLSYLVFYTVEESTHTVSVVRVLHQRQEWDKILKEYE